MKEDASGRHREPTCKELESGEDAPHLNEWVQHGVIKAKHARKWS